MFFVLQERPLESSLPVVSYIERISRGELGEWICFVFLCRPFGGRFTVRKVVGSRFIIISGNLTYRTVQDFLSEFYHPIHNQGFFCLLFFFLGSTHYWGNLVQYGNARKKTEAKKFTHLGQWCICRYGCISSADCTYGTIQALVRSLISLLLLQLFVTKLWVEGFIHESWSFAWISTQKKLPNLFWVLMCIMSLWLKIRFK